MSKPGRSRDVSSPEDYSNRSWSGNRGSHGHGNEDRLERLFALLCQDIAVAVIVMALYPSLCDRAIDPTLEVAVTTQRTGDAAGHRKLRRCTERTPRGFAALRDFLRS